MEWHDEGLIIGVRRYGETSVILDAMTLEHGRHLGLVKGGRSRRMQAMLQPGNSGSLTWRARLDERLGPVFEAYIDDWDEHLARMTDFWSAALLRTGRYSGTPVGRHRSIEGLSHGHFGRWIELFDATVRDLCQSREAKAFLDRARRMRVAMSKVLGVGDRDRGTSPVGTPVGTGPGTRIIYERKPARWTA